jgi:hypothetical protein
LGMGCASLSSAASGAGPLVELEVRVDVFMAPLFRRAEVAPFRVDATAPELAPGLRPAGYAGSTRSEAQRYQVATERQGRQGRASRIRRGGSGSLRSP